MSSFFGNILLSSQVANEGFLQFVAARKSQLFTLLIEHIELTVIAVLISVLLGVPLGIIVARVKKLSKPILGFSNVMQAIPSLALLGFLIIIKK
ncbi:MAG TPA: hypothetical protein DGK91_10565 [Clostridium sp.]|nr:hypothetical protein [Clostridium sp.]